MIVTTRVAGFDRLIVTLQQRAQQLARAARAAQHAGPAAAWRRAALLWPGFAADLLPPPGQG